MFLDNFKLKSFKLKNIIFLAVIGSVSYGLGTAEFSAASINVAENVSGGYVDITINGKADGSTVGLLGIRYKSTSVMTAKYNGSDGYSDDADNIYNAAALGSDSNSDTDNEGTDIQVYFSGETSLKISIKIDDDLRWEGGSSGTHEYLAIELYEPGGALTVEPADVDSDGTARTSFQINIVDNEASEPVLSFYEETTTANEHEYASIYIVVDGDIGLGDVGGVAPTFTWEIVQGSSNAAIVDEAEHTGSWDDHNTALSGDFTFNETDKIDIGGNGNRQAKRISYRAANDSRSEPEEQLEIRFKSSSNTHCAITGGTHSTHIHKITDYDVDGICDYGDCYPEPYFSSATATKNESGTSGNIGHTFTINLNGLTEIVPSTLNITMTTTTGNNGAAETNISGATISVPFNSVRMTSTTASFNIIDDAIYEGSTPETITLTIEGSPTGFVRNGARDVVQIVSVGDNETAPTASFHSTYDPTAANENAGNPDFRLKLDKVSQIPTNITITAGATGSGAQATGYQNKDSGSNGGRYDYWLGAGSNDADGIIAYTVPAFTVSGTAGPEMDITINDDAFFEDNESFRLTLSGTDSDASASATLDYAINQNNSDDQLPIITFETSSEESFTEDGSSNLDQTITVKLIDSSGDALVSGKDVAFSWSVTNADTDGDGVSAVVNQDYALKDAGGNDVTSGTISAFTDPPVFNIPIRIIGDNTAEENKKITITMAIGGSVEGVDATVSGAVSVTKIIQIVNDDADPEIQFSSTSAAVGEGSSSDSDDIVLQKVYSGSVDATEKTITTVVTAAGSSDRPATDNSNADGDDYDISTSIGSVSFGVNDASVVISLDVDDDDYYENTEQVTFTIASVSNGTAPTSNDNLVLTLNDADSAPAVSFDTDNNESSKAEGATPVLKVVQNIKSQYTTAVVNFAITTSGDFTANDFNTSGAVSVTLGPNSLAAVQLPISLVDDVLYEDNETMAITITAGSNCTINTSKNNASITVTDNDSPPILSFELVSSSPNEGSGSDAVQNVKIQLLDPNGSGNEQPLGRSGSFSYSIAGSGTNSATETSDWVLSSDPGTSKSVTISTSGGETASSFIIGMTLKDDNIFEYDEQLTLTLTSSPSNLTLTGGNATHVMTISEIESPPLVGFSSINAVTGKNETSANTYTPKVILDSGKTSDFDIKIIWDIDESESFSNTIAHAAAGSGHPTVADYSMTNSAGSVSQRTLTISAGNTYVDLPTVTFNGDSYYEDAEYIVVKLASAKYYNASDSEVGTNSWLSTTSTDHDEQRINIENTSGAKPTITWSSPTQNGTEPDVGNTTVINLGLTLDAVAAKDLKVKYSLLSTGYTSANEYQDNNAADSDDFEFSQADGSKIITIPAYSLVNTSTPTLTIKSESIDTYEMAEDIRISLVQWSNSDDATSGDADGATVTSGNSEILVYTIVERTTAPVLEFADADNSLSYDESASVRQISVQFKSSGTQRAAMPVYAYLTVDAATSTALNGTDFGSNDTPSAYVDNFEVIVPALSSSKLFNFYAVVDDRYEVAQTAIINLNAYASGALPSGKTLASNATDDGDEKITININASGSSEKPVVEWVDNTGSLPYSASSGTRTINEGSASSGYFTLQLSKFSEQNLTVNYSLITTGTLDALGHETNNTYPVDYNYWGTGSDGTGTSTALSTATGAVTFTGVENNISATSATQYLNIPVALINDDINEWSESITLKINESGNDDVTGTGVSDKLVILDNDDPPVVKFTAATSGEDVNEQTIGSSSPTFTFGLYDASGNTTVTGKKIYFSVVTDAADATPGSDFVALTNTDSDWIAIDAATNLTAQTAAVILDIEDDLIDEENQEVKVTLDVLGADIDGDKAFSSSTTGSDERAADAATAGSPAVHTYTILDDDAEPVLRFSDSDNASSIDEGATETITIDFDPESPNIVLSEKIITVTYSVSTTGSDCGSAGGCATGGTSGEYDYLTIADNTSLSIPAGDTDGTSFTITAVNDTRFESPQDIVIKMDASSENNATVSGGTGSQVYTLTINDDAADKPTAQFYNASDVAASSETVAEDNGSYTVTVKLSTISEKNVTIPYSIDFTNSTAIIDDNNTDLSSTAYPSDWRNWDSQVGSTTLNFTAGGAYNLHTATGALTILGASGTSATTQYEEFIVNITRDDVDEEDETLIFVLDETLTNANGGGSEFALTISNDDDAVVVQFAASNPITGDEDAADPAFVIELVDASGNQKESGKIIVIDWLNTLGTAEATDINAFATTGQVTFTPRTGSSSAAPVTQAVTIDVVDTDATYETEESFTLSVTNTTNSTEVGTQENAYAITNIDPIPKVEFVSSTYTLSEAAGDNGPTLDIGYRIATGDALNFSELTEEDITVYFKVSSSDANFVNGTDISNVADYATGTIQATSIDASGSSTITLTATGDGVDEADENFNLNMYTYDASQTSSNANVSILSNAVTPQNSESGSQGYDQAVITLKSDPNDEPEVSFYDVENAIVTSAMSVLESDGVATVSIKLNSVSAKTVTIPYTLTLDYDNDSKTARVGSSSATSYPYDYRTWSGLTVVGDVSGNAVTATGTIDIAAGQERIDFNIIINNDDIYEFDETIKLRIGTEASPVPTNAKKAASNTELVITVKNDGESKTSLKFSTTLSSDNENTTDLINFPIVLESQSGKDVIFKYTVNNVDNYPSDGDRFYNALYPNNKNIATKGIDYNFGSSITTNIDGDSIITIVAGQTTASIPLTIINDGYDEYDQVLRVSISVLSALVDNDAAENGDDSVYTFTIIDEDAEPYIRFEANVVVAETNAGNTLTKDIEISLVDEDSAPIESEKTITASYIYDTTETSGDYTSASLNGDGIYNEYEDDFFFENSSLSFSGRAYSYNPATKVFEETSGQNSKTVSLSIYGDALYEVDEYVNIELTPSDFVQSGELSSGDHSFVYTIQDDDGRPTVTWLEPSKNIQEGDPNDANGEGNYQNADIKVTLSKLSGTDILVQYSEKAGGTAESGTNTNFDFYLGADNTDLVAIGVNTKSVIIPAATSASSDLTLSVPIESWDDDIVEKTLTANYENFFLQIDAYRDKGPDKSWATVDDGLKDVSSENVVEVTIIDNDLPPSDFTVGSILTKTSNTDTVVASFWNPITPDYWNSYNTGLTVKIPIENNVRLDGGTVRLIAKVEGFSYNNILTSTITIIDSDLGDSITFDVSAQDFEGTEASPTAWFSNGNVVQISAIIADKDGNETTGSASPTSITIDEAVPSIAFYDINSVSSVGGTEVPNYWNGTNLEFNVNVKVLDVDQTVSNGKIRILAGIGGDESAAVYEKLGSPVSIAPSSNVEDGTVLVTISKEQIESLGEFVEGDSINIKGEIVDIAGNRTTINISTIKTFIDTTSPQINSVKSINIADGNNKDGLFGIDSIVNLKLTFSESLTLTSGTANIGFSDESISGLEIQQSSLQSVASIIVPYTVQANDISSKLTFTGLTSSAGNFRDVAGNDMTIFTAIDGSSLENLSTVEVDGLAPSAFTVDTVIVQGINTVSGYWNSNSTSLIIPLTNSKDQSGNIVADGDPSLIGGKVQILGRVWNTSTNTPGAYIEVGTTIILTDGIGGGTEPSGTWNEITGAYNYGQFPGKTLHFEIDAATMESALSVLANYPDESSANPEQNGKIDFAAIITDKAGNPMQGIATLGSELIVDEVMPLDPAIGLPLVGYNYTILSSIDNYIEILPDTVSGSGFSRSGFYNSTNTGVQFKSWIAFDDPNGAITIDRDVSLVGGNVQVQMASTNDASTATWSSIGDSAIVQQSDVDAGFITIIIDSSLIESISGDFVEGKTLYFRNKVTDKAGNIAYQSTVSKKSLIIDETPHVYADLTYSRKYVNGVDHIPTVTIKFDPTDYPYSPPKVSAIYETGNVPPIATTNALMAIGSDSSTYTYELDIPGDRSSNNYDGIVSIAIDATDKAGNPILTASVTNKDYLMVDNTRPEIEFKYENTTYEIAKNENKGKSGHIIKVVALPSEPMFLSPDLGNEVVKPTLSVDSLSTPDFTTNVVPAFDGDYNNIASDGDSITFSFTLPTKAEFEEKEFNLRLFINGTDLAGNSVDTLTGYTSSSAFTFDNKAPYFDQFLFADNSFIRTSTLRWYNNEQKMNSANIKFEPVDALASPSVVTEGDSIIFTDESLSGGYNELDRGLKGPYLINNNTLLTDALADSNTYNIIFKGTDMVGNVGSDTIKYVTFDTKAPTAKVTYETEYITSLSPKAGTVINVTFNEIQTVAPTMRLFYGADSAQNKGSASWIVDDLNTYIDTSSSAKIDGPITLINSSDDAKTWYHDLDSTDVQSNSEEIIYDGFIWAQLYSNDLAGNTFDSDSLIFSDFTNSLYLDNTEPTATLTYTNLRDSLLTEYSSDAELSYCCFAIAGDTVLVKVEMNEKVKYEPGTLPTLTLKYNSESVIEGYTQIGIEPISYPGFDIKDDVEQTAMTFHYKIVIQDSAKNDGTLKVTLNANDRSGTPITTYGSSLQKSGQVESSVALEIDNIHPWGDTDYPIFGVAQSEVTFPTGKFITTGFRVIENWINKATDNIYIDVPYQQPSTDSTLLGKNSGWGPQGKIDLQIRNIDLGTGQWQIFGNEDTIKSASSFTPFGNYTNMITINRGIEDLIPETMLNTGEGAFNRIQFRAVLKDKHGNITYGKPSDADSSNTENLFFANSSNTDTIRYDIVSPSLGAYNDGNFAGAVGSKIISSDTVSIGWSEFTDPGGAAASGVDLYEMQVYVYPSTWTGGNAADTLNRIDSLFTVDMDLDGIDDPGYWYKIYKEQAPSFNNPITVNSLESTVNDSISNMDIIYDYNDTLKHELHYMIYVRAFDVAGNASDTIYTNAIQRYNSAPVIIDNIADLILYEDVAWDYDTVKVTDLDLSTLQNDTFTYFIAPKKLVINSSGGLDSNLISINPPTVDSLNGLVSWTPIQDSTLTLEGIDTIIDQSGEYVFTFYVEDAYGFRDTINYNAIVNAVNDTPNVAILAPDRELSWAEDKPASEEVKINLSNYVRDIDNLDSELSWQFVIMDTSQLDEDFPLASVIIGPGTPKPVQTKLMKDYLGFDPSKGVDIPTLAKKSGSTTMRMLSAANSLITVDIDTTTDDNIYAIFNSDSNYHGSNHRVIFRVQDPFGAFDLDTVIINIIPENDPPVVATIDTIVINENDSIWIDFSQFTSDVDDSTLTFKIEGIYNTDSVSFLSEPYLSDGFGDTVLFNPFDLWSGSANFRITASDEEAESSQLFTLNVLRVPRPEIEVSLIQNNAFSSYVSIIIIDKQQKTKYLQLEVQNQRIDIDTVGAHTYTGDFSFGIGGGYSFDVIAVAEVGKTIYTNTFNLAPARVANRWYANSSDGRFSISGEPGSVDMDRNFLVLDSSLFIENFSDQASYVLGDEYYIFNKPIEINFGSIREDLAIYQRENGVIWKELPSLNRNGQILTFTENAGYFRLGPKTIIVPEETDLHQNYPNPFNPSTTIKYDIGLMDGLEQKVSVNVYNVVGQQVSTLVNNISQVGQFYVRWDGADKFGKTLPSGIYFIQLRTESGIIKNKKMMFLK